MTIRLSMTSAGARGTPDPAGTEVLLALDGVSAGYGAGPILRGVDLTVRSGQTVCLIGPNGAGKSTLLKTVSGLLRPTEGRILFQGNDISRLTPKQRLRRGIVHLPQERSLFPAMSVWQNVRMGAYLLRDRALVRRRLGQVAELFPIVARRRASPAGALSGGEQKQVELARSLMSDPTLILLDEPSIGLAPRARTAVFESITRLAGQGRTVLLVEQNARSGLAVADHAAVLDGGRVALTGTGAELLGSAEIARLYLGVTSK